MMDYSNTAQFLTAYVNQHYLGISIKNIQDVIGPQVLTTVPLAKESIAGVLNLRGRIVTAIDMNRRLGEPDIDVPRDKRMGIVTTHNDELFSLLVDRVEDVMDISLDMIEGVPPTLHPVWQSVCSGVYQVKGNIMIILDIEKILDLHSVSKAA